MDTPLKKLLWLALAVLLAVPWLLHSVFSGQVILPQVWSFGPLAFRYYGLIMALAAALGYAAAVRRAPAFQISRSQIDQLIFWVIVSGFVGARLYHVLSSAGYYAGHPVEIFYVWHGGLGIYGAVAGGAAGLALAKKYFAPAVSLWTLLDWVTPSVILGQIIGRWGNFFNYEAFGYPASVLWKMFVPWQFRSPAFVASNYFHPLFLYEAIGNTVILLILLRLERTALVRRGSGRLFLLYVLFYNAVRVVLEFNRIDSTFIGNFRLNVLVSSALILLSFILISRRHDYVLPSPHQS